MKYLILFLLPLSSFGQSISLTVSETSNHAEINFLGGEQVSLGLISTIQDNKHAIAFSYHPLSVDIKDIRVRPFLRVSDGVAIDSKVRKMYSYDYGVDVSFLRVVRSSIVVSGKSTYSNWQFGFSIPL